MARQFDVAFKLALAFGWRLNEPGQLKPKRGGIRIRFAGECHGWASLDP